MNKKLDSIPIKELMLNLSTKTWIINNFIEGIESPKPVKGSIRASIKEENLFIEGTFQAMITLQCDHCLESFQEKINYQDTEVILIQKQADRNSSLKYSSFSDCSQELLERIDPSERFKPEEWIFQQISLLLPLINKCSDNCPGPAKGSSFKKSDNKNLCPNYSESLDPRWAALKTFQANENMG